MNKWISTTDALPGNEVPVLAVVVPTRVYRNRKISLAMYIRAYTVDSSTYDGDDVDYDEARDESYIPAGWYEANVSDAINWRISDTVSHWMLLPEFPVSGDEVPNDK